MIKQSLSTLTSGSLVMTGLLFGTGLAGGAEPTEQEFRYCHQFVSEQLMECLDHSPGKLDLICLDQTRIMLKACYNQVHKAARNQNSTAPSTIIQQTVAEPSGR